MVSFLTGSDEEIEIAGSEGSQASLASSLSDVPDRTDMLRMDEVAQEVPSSIGGPVVQPIDTYMGIGEASSASNGRLTGHVDAAPESLQDHRCLLAFQLLTVGA